MASRKHATAISRQEADTAASLGFTERVCHRISAITSEALPRDLNARGRLPPFVLRRIKQVLNARDEWARKAARHDFVEASWALITPVHEVWRASGAREIPTYEAGEWGPREADEMLAADGRRWRTL